MESSLTVKGQTTIPKAIREHLGLQPGDMIKFFIHPDGTVVILPKIPVTALKGMFGQHQGKPVSIEEMDAAVMASATARHRLVRPSRKTSRKP